MCKCSHSVGPTCCSPLWTYLLEWSGKMPPERSNPGESGIFSFTERFWIKQIYDKTNVLLGQISVCAPPWPSPLCIKQSDIWKRAGEGEWADEGRCWEWENREVATEPSGWRRWISMNFSLRKSQKYLQRRQKKKMWNLLCISPILNKCHLFLAPFSAKGGQ